jgi:hypothetical protein
LIALTGPGLTGVKTTAAVVKRPDPGLAIDGLACEAARRSVVGLSWIFHKAAWLYDRGSELDLAAQTVACEKCRQR